MPIRKEIYTGPWGDWEGSKSQKPSTTGGKREGEGRSGGVDTTRKGLRETFWQSVGKWTPHRVLGWTNNVISPGKLVLCAVSFGTQRIYMEEKLVNNLRKIY